MNHAIFIALGTNLGERAANLHTALAALPPAVNVVACSPIYETPPWGYLDQPAFLNQVIQAETSLGPQELLAYLKQIEARMGRSKLIQNGPRIIDLDILFYDDLILDTLTLSIPHPRMRGRAFVLVPLADLAPSLRHPVLGLSVQQLADETDRSGIIKVAESE